MSPKLAGGRMPLDDITYDFETDQWVAQRLIKARWIDRELPPPLEPPKPGRWLRSPAKGHLRENYYGPIGLTALATFAILFYALTVRADLLALISAVILWIGVPIALYWVTRPAQLQANKDDLHLLEDPEDRDTCLVEIVIVRDGQPIGADRGVAWFENGRLLFNGARTSFAIGGEDVQPRRFWARLHSKAPIDRLMAVPLRLQGIEAYVAFQPLRGPNLSTDHEERFVERLGAFRARPPQSRGPRQWPPLSTGE